jgi:DNA-directed RNA polymerase specialized sigma subunit
VDILRWDEVVNQFVNKFSRLSPEKKDDLRQEFYLALLQANPPPQTRDEVVSILHKVLDKTRRQAVLSKRRTADLDECRDIGVNPDTENRILLEEMLSLLPDRSKDKVFFGRRDILQCLFFGGMTEEEVGIFFGKSQSWVSKQKKKGLETIKSIVRGKNAHLNKTDVSD